MPIEKKLLTAEGRKQIKPYLPRRYRLNRQGFANAKGVHISDLEAMQLAFDNVVRAGLKNIIMSGV